MSKRAKKKSSKTLKPYMTAKQLGLLPIEREALIAFVKAPALGNNIALNGHAHHYDQSTPDDVGLADDNHCGTAGCVGGYVFFYATIVGKMKKLRGETNADSYLTEVMSEEIIGDWDEADKPNPNYQPMLEKLYEVGKEGVSISEAKKAVDTMLRTGKVPRTWTPGGDDWQ